MIVCVYVFVCVREREKECVFRIGGQDYTPDYSIECIDWKTTVRISR